MNNADPTMAMDLSIKLAGGEPALPRRGSGNPAMGWKSNLYNILMADNP